MATDYFVIYPASEGIGASGTNTNPKTPDNTRIASAQRGSAADKAWTGNGSYQGWQVFMGPFSSAAAARAAHPPSGLQAVLDTTVAGALAGALTGLFPGSSAGANYQAASAAANAAGGVDWQSLFLRIGEVLLGLVLIAVGVAKLTNAVPVATKIAGAVK
jgi:hypothetical protein